MNESNKTPVTLYIKNGGSFTGLFSDIDLDNTRNIQFTGDTWYFEDGKCYHSSYDDKLSNSNN